MGVAVQEASGGDVDFWDGRRATNGHLVVKQETGRADVRSFVFYRGVVRDWAEKSAPEFSKLGEGSIDGGALELTSQCDHVTEGGKMGCLGADIDLESVFGIRNTVDSCDHRLDVELCREGRDVGCNF